MGQNGANSGHPGKSGTGGNPSLSVYLLATSLKNCLSYLHENLSRDVFSDQEVLIKFLEVFCF